MLVLVVGSGSGSVNLFSLTSMDAIKLNFCVDYESTAVNKGGKGTANFDVILGGKCYPLLKN